MKTIATLIISFALQLVSAQTAYDKGMTKAFDLWKEGKNDQAVNLFERIANAEKENWLPYYYVAQVHITTSFDTKDQAEIENRLKKATDALNQANSFSKNNAELKIMEAMLNTAYVVSDPSRYGASLSPKVEMLYQEAKKIEPENPRAILYHAEWQMGAAKFWGKDPKAFCPEIEKAILYFEKQTEKEAFYPSWGINQIARIQENCK